MSVYSLASKLNSVQIEVKSKVSKNNPVFTGTISSTAALSAVGNITTTNGNITTTTGSVSGATITSTGNISATGNITTTGGTITSTRAIAVPLVVGKYILMVIQAIELILLMLVPILRHLIQEAMAQRFVCGHKLILQMLIMPSVLMQVVFGFRCLIRTQSQASTGMQELRGLQG